MVAGELILTTERYYFSTARYGVRKDMSRLKEITRFLLDTPNTCDESNRKTTKCSSVFTAGGNIPLEIKLPVTPPSKNPAECLLRA